jgi:hypothetical protein
VAAIGAADLSTDAPGSTGAAKDPGLTLSIKEGLKMLYDVASDIFCQKRRNAFLAPSRPPATEPSAIGA